MNTPGGTTAPQAFCTHCGNPIDEDVHYCGNCGTRIAPDNLTTPASSDHTEPPPPRPADSPPTTPPPHDAGTAPARLPQHSSNRRWAIAGIVAALGFAALILANATSNSPNTGGPATVSSPSELNPNAADIETQYGEFESEWQSLAQYGGATRVRYCREYFDDRTGQYNAYAYNNSYRYTLAYEEYTHFWDTTCQDFYDSLYDEPSDTQAAAEPDATATAPLATADTAETALEWFARKWQNMAHTPNGQKYFCLDYTADPKAFYDSYITSTLDDFPIDYDGYRRFWDDACADYT